MYKRLEEEIVSGDVIQVPGFLKSWLSEKKRLFVDGEWRDTRGVFSTLDPATEEKLSDVCAGGNREVEQAVDSARAAFDRGEWANRSLKERAQTLKKIGDLILENRAVLALLETLDTGKPIRESFEGDIPRAAQNFHFFSDFACDEQALCYKNANETHFAVREPLGVSALVTPWNLPLYLETWKLAPCLMMGNSCILKPSELTPLTATYLTELLLKTDLPKGVFNLVHGLGENSTGEFLVGNDGVSAISFTGETSTGRAIMKSAATGPTRVSFELGGKGACIVFSDADMEQVIESCLRSAFRNQGEICLSTPRIFVEKKKYDNFLDGFMHRASQIKIGNPLSHKTEMGALISKSHWEKVSGYLQRIEAPGKILLGGSRPESLRCGYFLSPTVVTDIDPSHPVSQEEIFGPVVSIYPFDDEKQVIQLANGTPYGLSASVWTSDLDRGWRVAKQLKTGLVWVNSWFVRDLRVPFGGQKRSGVGREGGRHSLDFFSEWKSICMPEGEN